MSKRADEYTTDAHFAGKNPVVRAVYDRLLTALRKIGDVREDPKKTSIHLVRVSAPAGVMTRKDYLLLNMKSDQFVEGPRVVKAEQLSARRFHFTIKLSAPGDVDAELKGWLQAAYDLSG